jgi:hypothetical protein
MQVPINQEKCIGFQNQMKNQFQLLLIIFLLNVMLFQVSIPMQNLEVFFLFISFHPIVLNWNFRFANIKQELLGYEADILCLQEVDNFYEINSFLKEHGYIGYFKEKTSKKDGCATFFKSNK